MKIQKYQYGASYTPISREVMGQSQGEPATSPSSEKKDDKLIEQEIIKVLGENGIPTDVDYFLSQAQSFLQDSTNIFSGKKTNTMSQLIRLRSLANRLQHNNALYKNATDRIKVENTGSDVAISNDGNLYVYDGESVKKVTPTDYSKNPEEYQVLTNAELIHLRERDPELKFDESILHDLSNSIGMKSIMEQIIGAIKKFGTSTQKGYTVKAGGQVQRGLEALMSLDPDGLYEIETSDSKAAQDINSAIIYLYKNLNTNAKNVLRATTAAEGLNPSDVNDVTRILKEALFEHTDTSIKVNAIKDPTKGSGSGSGDSAGSQIKEVWGDFVTKDGGSYRNTNIVMPGGNVSFNVPAKHYNFIEGKENTAIDNVTLGDESFNNLISKGLIDTRRTSYIGDLPIDNMAFAGKDIIVDNTRGGTVMYLPIKQDGELDLSMMKQMSEIQDQIIKSRITNTEAKKKIWEDNGFTYNEALDVGVPVNETLGRYWTQVAYTSTAANSFKNKDLKSSSMLSPVDDSVIENLGSAYNLNPNNKNKSKVDLTAGWFGKSYQGMLFIPMQDNQNEVLVAGGAAYMPKPNTDVIKARQDAVRLGGGYDYGTGLYNRNLAGTTAGDLD